MSSHPLGIHLADIGQSFGESVAWHLISKFISEFRRLTLGPLRKGPRVGDGSRHDAANRRRELEDVRH